MWFFGVFKHSGQDAHILHKHKRLKWMMQLMLFPNQNLTQPYKAGEPSYLPHTWWLTPLSSHPAPLTRSHYVSVTVVITLENLYSNLQKIFKNCGWYQAVDQMKSWQIAIMQRGKWGSPSAAQRSRGHFKSRHRIWLHMCKLFLWVLLRSAEE